MELVITKGEICSILDGNNRTCCIDTGSRSAPHPCVQPTHAGTGIEDFQINRVGPNGRIGACVL